MLTKTVSELHTGVQCLWRESQQGFGCQDFYTVVRSRKDFKIKIFCKYTYTTYTTIGETLFCRANFHESCGLFYVSVGVNFSDPKINSMISLTFTKDAKCLFYLTYTEIDH